MIKNVDLEAIKKEFDSKSKNKKVDNNINDDESSKKKYEVSLRPESAEDLRKNYEAIEHIVIE